MLYLVNLFPTYSKIITGISRQVSFYKQLAHKMSLWHVCDYSIPDDCNSCEQLTWQWAATYGSFATQCNNSKLTIFQEKLLTLLNCYNFLWVQWWHNCSPAASFSNRVMTPYLLKLHLQTFLSVPITQKCQIVWVVTLFVGNERYALHWRLLNWIL